MTKSQAPLMKRFLIVFFVLASFLFFPASAFAYYTNMPASFVIGQPDFTSNSANQGGSPNANTLNVPSGITTDGQKFFAVDESNNRVLIYNTIPSGNSDANTVVGQPNFAGNFANQGGTLNINTLNDPRGIAIYANKMVIADTGNHRLLIFNNYSNLSSSNANADVVIGQVDFTHGVANQGGSAGNNTINSPRGVLIDQNGKLYIADSSNSRVLIFNSIPTSNNASADIVLRNTSGTTMNAPTDIWTDNKKLIIADKSNNRVLVYNSMPNSNSSIPDVVIGQADFSHITANQGVSVNSNTMSSPFKIYSNGQRLFVTDQANNRVLIFNTIPSFNNAPADLVLGQANFSSSSSNQGGSVGANTLSNLNYGSLFEINSKFYLADAANNRILIFNNLLSGPQLNTTVPPTTNSDGTYHLVGNILLGNRGTYSMQKVEASINGSGYGNVTSLDGGRDNGLNQSLYEFTENFSPWSNNGTKENWSSNGYTISIRAQSLNAETDTQFYFQPFTLTSVSSNTYKLNIPKNKFQILKDNLDSFSVSYSKDKKTWTTLQDNLKLTDNIFDTNSGVLTLTTTKQIPTGNYFVKIVAKDKQSHSQDSNTLTTNSNGVISYAPTLSLTNLWFPIQISKISGSDAGMLSNYYPLTKTSYTTSTSNPTISGIAFVGSKVTVLVTNPTTLKQNTYTTITKPNSTFTITPTISSGSVLDVWVTKDGLVSEVPAFKLSITSLDQ